MLTRGYHPGTPKSRTQKDPPVKFIDLTDDTDIEEDLDSISFLFDRYKAPNQPLPSPGSLKAVTKRAPKPPTPPLPKPNQVSPTIPGINLLPHLNRESEKGEKQDAQKRQKLLIPNKLTITERYTLGGCEDILKLGPRQIKNHRDLREIWNPTLYFESGIHIAFKEQLTKVSPILQRLKITPGEFGRILLSVAHFVTIASGGYEASVLAKPGLHPEGLHNNWTREEPRNVPFAELLVAFTKGPVQIYESLYAGVVDEYGTLYVDVEGERYRVPKSDFTISHSHLLLALHTLAQIGVVHVTIGRLSPSRKSIGEQYFNQYNLSLSVLESIAAVQPAGADYRYGELPEGSTLFFSVVWDYEYAWYGILKSVLGTFVQHSYYSAGFNGQALNASYTYTWNFLQESYWCPVLLRDSTSERTQIEHGL